MSYIYEQVSVLCSRYLTTSGFYLGNFIHRSLHGDAASRRLTLHYIL